MFDMEEFNLNGEIWVDMPIAEFAEFYEISNFGRMRSKVRQITRTNRFDVQYTQIVGGKILSTRTNGKDPHIYGTLQFMHPVKRKVISKTVYPHKMVALAFVEKPSDKLNKVTFKDRDPTNIVPENLVWTDQEFLSKRNMVEHPHNRNRLGIYQKKIGVPTEAIKKEVIKLSKEGYDDYTIGEMVGRSRSWGYNHVGDILKEKRNRDAAEKQKQAK